MAATTEFIIILVHIFTFFVSTNAIRPTNFSSILIFGDSTVDTGNNNYILTLFKGNHYPYGRDFPGHVPTGRFSNGKFAADFIASFLNLKDTVPPFLEATLPDDELLSGVSFASAGSGYDELNTAPSGVISVSKQIEHFKSYVAKIKGIAGEDRARRILESAFVGINAGINDFAINFYDLPTRKVEFSIAEYQDFLLKKLQIYIKVWEKLLDDSSVMGF
ncbi:hypothetical protein L6164_028749 [Bauhinia variegata]|uniref:Uncharacterized protein n=1 Tax=Bauhinia variegata TaxID=167791 RepID=A0ACB9L751_BAUVA|nr:hypothetical protein L6164_028749 [Bauhinia variegata]